MIDVFRDPVWQFIGAVLALIAIGISISLYLLQRRRKILSYEVISTTSLLSVSEEVQGKLQILYENEPVKKVHLFVISLANTGNVPILESDFSRPVNLEFSENVKILSAEISAVTPENLDAKIEVTNNSIKLIPTLLNSGDTIKIKSLVSEFDGEYKIDGRVVGVHKIDKRVERDIGFILSTIGSILMLLGFVIAIIIDPKGTSHQSAPFMITAGIGAMLMYIGLLSSRRMRSSFLRVFTHLSCKSKRPMANLRPVGCRAW